MGCSFFELLGSAPLQIVNFILESVVISQYLSRHSTTPFLKCKLMIIFFLFTEIQLISAVDILKGQPLYHY